MAVKSRVGEKSLGGGKTRIGDFVRTRRGRAETTFIAVVIGAVFVTTRGEKSGS